MGAIRTLDELESRADQFWRAKMIGWQGFDYSAFVQDAMDVIEWRECRRRLAGTTNLAQWRADHHADIDAVGILLSHWRDRSTGKHLKKPESLFPCARSYTWLSQYFIMAHLAIKDSNIGTVSIHGNRIELKFAALDCPRYHANVLNGYFRIADPLAGANVTIGRDHLPIAARDRFLEDLVAAFFPVYEARINEMVSTFIGRRIGRLPPDLMRFWSALGAICAARHFHGQAQVNVFTDGKLARSNLAVRMTTSALIELLATLSGVAETVLRQYVADMTASTGSVSLWETPFVPLDEQHIAFAPSMLLRSNFGRNHLARLARRGSLGDLGKDALVDDVAEWVKRFGKVSTNVACPGTDIDVVVCDCTHNEIGAIQVKDFVEPILLSEERQRADANIQYAAVQHQRSANWMDTAPLEELNRAFSSQFTSRPAVYHFTWVRDFLGSMFIGLDTDAKRFPVLNLHHASKFLSDEQRISSLWNHARGFQYLRGSLVVLRDTQYSLGPVTLRVLGTSQTI